MVDLCVLLLLLLLFLVVFLQRNHGGKSRTKIKLTPPCLPLLPFSSSVLCKMNIGRVCTCTARHITHGFSDAVCGHGQKPWKLDRRRQGEGGREGER